MAKPNHVAMTASAALSASLNTSGDEGMIASYVALTALTDRIRTDELSAVAAALQTQITRDFAPEWGVNAVIAAAPFEAIPAGYVPLIVQDALEAEGCNGFHRTQSDDSAYIIIPYGRSWSLAASHELLRMLANPTGSARLPGVSRMGGQGTVEYLLDVCAPCQDVSAAYSIDGIVVSDFCTRGFLGSAVGACSFTGALRAGLEPGVNGVVTWLADDGLLYQARADDSGRVRVHGGYSLASRERMLLRELVDRLTPDRLTVLSNAPATKRLAEAQQNARRVRLANLTRYQDEMGWRFGYGAAEPVAPEPRRSVGRVRAGGSVRVDRTPVEGAEGKVDSTL